MKRWIATALSLAAVAAVAANEPIRVAALEQLRTIAEPLISRGPSTEPRFDDFQAAMVEQLSSQLRAERALELSINRYEGAAQYVIDHAQSWRGTFEPSQRLDALITTAINAPLLETRMAGFEIHLAQYDLEKSPAEVDRLTDRLYEDPQGAGPWALWSMAVIGARGVDRERVFDELLLATRYPDEYVRRWAVDSLAKFGGAEVIDPLLSIAVEDASATVRERAFCGLAASGTLHVAERYLAVPWLLAIAEDPYSDAQTLEWTYQALREISGLHDVPNDPVAWREYLQELAVL
ncbi:MAG TPA: HEAT repeat domain-containing protein [Xanthomonadales bacterium]|nr:HEAT repeat domain-containing protein [Xanthomonadales bacterium]